MLLYYIRHGDPTYDPDCLTPLGKRQAEAVAKRLAAGGIDRIYASSSIRAQETAQPTAELTKKEIVTLDFFNEKYACSYFFVPYGQRRTWMEQIPAYQELFVSDEMYALGDRWYEHPALAGTRVKEGAGFYAEKFDAFLASLGYEHDRKRHCYRELRKNDDRVAIFAHGGVGGVFLSTILDIPYPSFVVHQALSHTGVTVIEFGSGDTVIPRLLQYGNDSHLYREGLPTRHCNKTLL